MAKSHQPLNPPVPSDRLTLTDYSSTIQNIFDQLFNAAHDHLVLTSKPGTNDGSVQTVSIVDDGTNVYLVVKTNRGWFKSPTFTAL